MDVQNRVSEGVVGWRSLQNRVNEGLGGGKDRNRVNEGMLEGMNE